MGNEINLVAENIDFIEESLPKLTSIPLSNYSAARAPVGSDDATEGYSVCSEWVDISNNNIYYCVNTDVDGDAKWVWFKEKTSSPVFYDLGSTIGVVTNSIDLGSTIGVVTNNFDLGSTKR